MHFKKRLKRKQKNSEKSASCLLIFCKAPVPGQVKTRLTPHLTARQAAKLHIRLSLRTLSIAYHSELEDIQLWCSPDIEHPFFKQCEQSYPVSLHLQQGDDLGKRMDHAIAGALKNYKHVALVGCDSPSLTSSDLENAVTALMQNNDVVLAPAEDGGYVLIGLNKPQPILFENIPWGTPEVLQLTRSRIHQNKLKCFELSEQWDIDIPEDLQRPECQEMLLKI